MKLAMLNDFIDEYVEETGVKKTVIAAKLNITYQAFLNKLSGVSEFKVGEAALLKAHTSMSDYDFLEIFVRD